MRRGSVALRGGGLVYCAVCHSRATDMRAVALPILFVVLLSAGCGLKGPLYLPEDDASADGDDG